MSSKQSPQKLKKAKPAKAGKKHVKPSEPSPLPVNPGESVSVQKAKPEKSGKKTVKPSEPSQLPENPGECATIQKAKKTTNVSEKQEAQKCNRPKNYKTPAEKRSYLELKVTPVLMEGMLGLARDQPADPVSYLEEYWLKEQHKCNVNLKQNSI